VFGRALTVARVRGIDIRVDVSWIFIALLITWSFWVRFTTGGSEYASGVAAVMAFVAAVLFFASILVHELAHALEAQRRGVTVAGITLFVFGGVTESRFDVRRPVDELSLTIVGPLSSFLIAALFGMVSLAASGADLDAVADVVGLVGWINLALGAFNLLPGAPLDGGRVLRSVVWWVTRDRRRATRVAAHAGQILGAVMVAIGVLQFVALPDLPVGGLWLALIGWFLLQAARAELQQAELEKLLDGRTVGDMLPADSRVDAATAIPPDAPLEEIDFAAAAIDALEPVERDGAVLVRDDAGTVRVLTTARVARFLQELTSLDAYSSQAETWGNHSGRRAS